MIVVDTSALMAIVQDEPQADACIALLESETDVLISAATVAEALIVSGRRGFQPKMAHTIDAFGFVIAPVSAVTARRVAEVYARWGKGVHAASLNLGDCFAYDLARESDCPLLYVGQDFAKTDVTSAL